MLTTQPTTSAVPRTAMTRRPALRWLLTFAGFPLGAVAARAVAGPIDDTAAAVVGGLVNGAILGAAQGWALRPLGISPPRWLVATAVGLAAGLGIGATTIGFSTSMGALAAQGAICGAAVGIAQAVVLAHRDRRIALAWPFALAALWALGWTITTAIGVDVERHHAVFGSSGAITVTVLTAALPLALGRKVAR